MVSLFSQVITRSRGQYWVRGVTGVHWRDGQQPNTWQAMPNGATQLRSGSTVLVRGRLAA